MVPIYHFNKEDHKGSSQNWNMAQDQQGIMYFANNAGLLVFDGTYWECYQVANETKVRSVGVAEDGKIFVGAEGEIGYFFPNEQGRLIYTSLYPLLEEKDKQFNDVWDIKIIGERVYFRTGSHILVYDNDIVKVIFNGASLNYITKIGEKLLIHDDGLGLFQLEGETFLPFHSEMFFENMSINGVLPFEGDTFLISTINNGLFLSTQNMVKRWNIDATTTLKQGRIYCASTINETTFVFWYFK